MILAGYVEYDRWANIIEEYPKLERVTENQPLIKRMINYLYCSLLKISHHGRIHNTPLDVYEKMIPDKAIISTKQETSTKKPPFFNYKNKLLLFRLTCRTID